MQTTTASAQTQPTTPDVSLRTLRRLAADLAREYPAAGQRVEHALYLVTAGHVERANGRGWWVQSEREPGKEYFVLTGPASCTCQDWQRHGTEFPCKHLFSTMLYQRAERIDAEQSDPTVQMVDIYGRGLTLPVGLVDIYRSPAALGTLAELTDRGWAVLRGGRAVSPADDQSDLFADPD